MGDTVSALLKLPATLQAQANVEAARQAYYDYLTASPEGKAAAYDNAVKLLGESAKAALKTKGLDAGTRGTLQTLLDDIDSEGRAGDNRGVKKFVKNLKIRNVNIKDAGRTNAWWKDVKGYDNPPYMPETMVLEFELGETKTFVRVYDGINSSMKGQWFMYEEDIAGLTPKQIQEKYALPSEPKFIVDLTIKEGTKLRVGEANALFGFKGKGIQLDLMGQRVGDWSNPRTIE